MNEYIQIKVPLNPDQDGFTGRECPTCESYFKIQLGTGLKGENLPCFCPYCGHRNGHDHFWTKEQIEYAKSIALNKFTGEILRNLKKFERKPNPRALFDIGIQIKGSPHPIQYYREKKLEQEVICNNCTLRYMIYGAFGFCPDCGIHNSLQILEMNLSVFEKMVILAEDQQVEIARKLIDNALEDAVAAIDGFGRELCKLYRSKATDSQKAEKISFQSIIGAKDKLIQLFNFDISSSFTFDEWKAINIAFQKRHVMAHSMGVIDQKYIDNTGESPSRLGKKVSIEKNEVSVLLQHLRKLGKFLKQEFEKLP